MGLRCWLIGHDPVLERYERGPNGSVRRTYKHEVRWRCQVCWREVGATTVKPSTRLLRELRIQAGNAQRRFTLVRKA